MPKSRGFTLIEMIAVLVVLGIVASLSTRFIVTAIDSYSESEARQKLLAKGRTSVEQIARYVRSAVPNSLRTSSSGQCLEIMPSVAGVFYEGRVAEAESGSCAATSSSLTSSPLSFGLGSAEHLVIGAFEATEIYSSSSPAARVGISSTSSSPSTMINFSLPHCFYRNSINNRAFVGDDPIRFCLDSNNLVLYQGYGLLTNISEGQPNSSASSATMADNVEADGTAFVLSDSTEDRNAALEINLIFSEGNISVPFNQSLLIRNVP